jgi:hypothetical protein
MKFHSMLWLHLFNVTLFFLFDLIHSCGISHSCDFFLSMWLYSFYVTLFIHSCDFILFIWLNSFMWHNSFLWYLKKSFIFVTLFVQVTRLFLVISWTIIYTCDFNYSTNVINFCYIRNFIHLFIWHLIRNKNCLGSFQVLWNKNCNIKS